MTYYDILQFVNAFIALILGSFLIWILSKLFRYKIWKYFFILWKDILVVSVLASFVLIFIPFQFKQIVFYMLIVIYLLLFRLWGPNKLERKVALGKSGKIRRFISPKEAWIVMFFILIIVIILGKWKLIITSGMESINDSKQLLVNINGDLSYDYDKSWSYGVWLSDTNHNGNYDTVKYDINRDGIVDLIHKDTNQDSIIDEVVVLNYWIQKLRLYLFLIFCIIAIMLWGIDRKRLKWQLKDKWITKEEDLKVSNDKREEYKELKKKANQKLEDIKSKDKILDEEKEIDLGLDTQIEIRNFSKLFSWFIVIVFSFTAIVSPIVSAISQTEMMMQMGQYENCANSPFDDIQCEWVLLETRRYMQHIVCSPEFRKEAQEWWERMQIMSLYYTEEEIQKTLDEYQIWWNNWKSKTPKNCMIWDNKEETWEIWTEWENNIENSNNQNESETKPLSEILNPQKEINEKFSWDGEWEKFNNSKVKALYDKAKKEGSPDIDYFKMLDGILKYEKAMIDSSGKLLEWVNKLNKLENIAIALSNETNLEKKQKILEKALDTLNRWKWEKLEVDDLFNTMADDLKKIKRKKKLNFRKYMKKLDIENWKFGKSIKVLDIFGKWMDIYSDSRDFHKLLWWDPWKVSVAVSLTTVWKWTLGANPVDVATGLIWWGLTLIGQDDWAEQVSAISAGDIAKKTIEDAFTTTTDDFKNVVAYEAQESKKVWKDKQYNIIEKTGIQLNSIATLTYGLWVFGIQKILEFQEPNMKAFSDGIKEISKWFK